MRRRPLLAATALLLLAGLALRLGPWRIGPGHLPLAVHHSGGGFLWGGMVYTLLAAARPKRWVIASCLAAALAVIVAAEGSRLPHGPLLDGFRLTLPGQLLLGRLFAPMNIVVDAFGAACAAVATRHLVQPAAEARPYRRIPAGGCAEPELHGGAPIARAHNTRSARHGRRPHPDAGPAQAVSAAALPEAAARGARPRLEDGPAARPR